MLPVPPCAFHRVLNGVLRLVAIAEDRHGQGIEPPSFLEDGRLILLDLTRQRVVGKRHGRALHLTYTELRANLLVDSSVK